MKQKTIVLILVIITGILLILMSSCATPRFNVVYYNQHCVYKRTPHMHDKMLFHPTNKQNLNLKQTYK